MGVAVGMGEGEIVGVRVGGTTVTSSKGLEKASAVDLLMFEMLTPSIFLPSSEPK